MSKDLISDRRHRLKAKIIQQLMFLKDAISHKVDEASTLSDEDEAPYDEVTDLFEPSNLVSSETISLDSEEEHAVEASNNDEEILRPLRKRQRPARYRE
jgi:hypothetical protein